MTASEALRRAIYSMASHVTIGTTRIPLYEEFVQETSTNRKAIIEVNGLEIEMYMVIKNQEENESSGSKCGQTNIHSVQIHIYTVFPSDSGTSEYAENIEEQLMYYLFHPGTSNSKLSLFGQYNLDRSVKSRGRNLTYNDDTKRIWTRIITLDNWITKIYS